ncbi:MAG: hypothetical protein KI791_14750 [Cyclobacteriaceae bacterium]|nr:hypothetical protein [Cyclobacteriaceae bacterium SS2]
MPNILFLTTANLATNPRLVKELITARNNGIRAEVIAFSFDSPYQDTRVGLVEDNMLKIRYLSDNKANFFDWLFIGIIHKTVTLLSSITNPRSLMCSAFYINKRTIALYRYLFLHKRKYQAYQLIVGHNIGAFYPAYFLSKALQIPFGIDVEDYHPGERVLAGDPGTHRQLKEKIFKRVLPNAKYLSHASPLIKEYTKELIRPFEKDQSVVINNSFYSVEFLFARSGEGLMRYVWFSQYVDFGRGLEYFIEAADEIKWKGISLTIIGELRSDFSSRFNIAENKKIEVKGPMSQKELHLELCTHDVGLAIEDNANDLNRDLALTNKIFAYTQAGLFLLITQTSAQKQFVQEYPGAGKLVSLEKTNLIDAFGYINSNSDMIRSLKKRRFDQAGKLSFENEEKKLLELWSL